jgi:zinc/manganese transport system substrate-binding protein
MRIIRRLLIAMVMGTALPSPASADVKVFACEPEWAALAREVGGEKVSAFSATHARQDPHHIRARPSLIARIRRADMVFCSGAGLEVGWLPLLMQRGAKAGVQPGQPGHLMAADLVPKLEKPAVIDRSLGDIHPEGNPHVHLDPRNILRVASELTKRLTRLDRPNAAYYQQKLTQFHARWQADIEDWKRRAARLSGMPVIVHHKSYSYLISWIGLVETGTLEVKPGIPPTASHLNQLLDVARSHRIRAILRTPYDPSTPSEWLSGKTGIPALLLPYTVEKDAKPGALADLFRRTLNLLEKAHAGS